MNMNNREREPPAQTLLGDRVLAGRLSSHFVSSGHSRHSMLKNIPRRPLASAHFAHSWTHCARIQVIIRG